MTTKTIARGGGYDYVLIGSSVYVVKTGWQPDSDGFPMGARWECEYTHWTRFRGIYLHAVDVTG